MAEDFIASIDCGTTSARFIVFNAKAEIIELHQIEFKQIYPHPGWHEQKGDELIEAIWQCIEETCKKLAAKNLKVTQIKGIGITNQRETTIVWSKSSGKVLYNAIVWPDTRTAGTVEKLSKKSNLGIDVLKSKTGLPLSTYFAGVKLRWLLDNVEDVRRAHEDDDLRFGTIDTWILWNLTGGQENGGIFKTDVTNASRTMFMDLKTLEWDEECLEFFGIKRTCLADIVSNCEVYGKMSTGALKGLPIAGMIGDQQGALVGQKCLKAGEAKNTYGTGAFLLYNTGKEMTPSKHGLLTTTGYRAGPESDPIYALEGSIAVAGSSVKWLRDSLNLIKTSEEIGQLAGKVETTGGVYFVTGFSGLFAPYWDDSATGMLIGITGYTTKEHIARATLEATCFQTRAILEAMQKDAKSDLRRLRVDGGMTNCDPAMQIQADVIGIEVERPNMRESTALGSAICAAVALKLFGWDLNKPETFENYACVSNKGKLISLATEETIFEPKTSSEHRSSQWKGWNRAVERSKGWTQLD